MNIYEIMKSGKTPDEVRAIVEKEIKSAQVIIEKEQAAKKEEIKEARTNLVNAFEDYYLALTGKWFNSEEYDSLERIIKETEKEIMTVQAWLEKTKETEPKKPVCNYWKPESVKFTTDDAVIKNFINNLV